MKTCDVLIIGAGSVGVPLAFYCAERGLSTIVIEKNASWGRGQNRAAIGGLRATHSDPAKIRLCQESIRIVAGLEAERGIDVEWRSGGYLFVAYDEQREKAFRDLLTIQKDAGLDIDWIGPARVSELCPGIRTDGLRGGTFSPGDGYASPLMTSTAFHRLARGAGAEFRFGETVTAIRTEGGRVASVRTDKDEYEAGTVVNAAGAFAADIGGLVDLELPVHPDCHEAGVTEPCERFLEPMLVDIRPDDESGNYYFYQTVTGQIVFCITPKPQIWGTDTDSTSSFLPLVSRRMVELYPRLRNLKVRRTWRGMYPMTPDGLPIVGYTEEYSNLMLAVGMCGQGYMLGPGLGKILSSAIVDGVGVAPQVFEELSLYRKFEGMELLK
ncbi:MAG: sulfurtransferase [Spirochaetae bacterium HGW-Spirochaetae-3]|jgi:sarcosine oxidase subunit beta|nr:MAG: sulfurtransferase [Spirochaetae bacterium HGW-Spirochaetae-3]